MTALTFGFGPAETIESVIVTWPGGGEDRFEGLPVRKEWVLHCGGAVKEAAR